MSSLDQMQMSVERLATVGEEHHLSERGASSPSNHRVGGAGQATLEDTVSSPVGRLDFSFLSDDGVHVPVHYPLSPYASSDYSSDCGTATESQAPTRHRVDVRNFPFEFAVGEKKDTVPFQLCGDDWFIRLYPGGFSRETSGYVGVFLCYAGTRVPITVNYSVTAVVEGSKALRSLRFEGKIFTKRGQGRGWDLFVRREDLRRVSPSGCFSLVVDMDARSDLGGFQGAENQNSNSGRSSGTKAEDRGREREGSVSKKAASEKDKAIQAAYGKGVEARGKSRAMWKPRTKQAESKRV